MAPLTFMILLDPVPWARPRFQRVGGKLRAFTQSNVARYVRDFRIASFGHLPKTPFEGPLDVSLIFQFKPPKKTKRTLPHVKPDLDNFIKGALDAMNPSGGWRGFWKDDAQIVTLAASKRYGDVPFVWVRITPSEEPKSTEGQP